MEPNPDTKQGKSIFFYLKPPPYFYFSTITAFVENVPNLIDFPDDEAQGNPSAGEQSQNGDGSYNQLEGSDPNNKQPRRRSKKVTEGRKFKCDRCSKTYLSYPALYTHYKLKHSQGEKPNLPSQTGRGRGRPRKNKQVDPISEEYFQSDDKKGGPVNPLHGLKAIVSTYFPHQYKSMEEFPLYRYLYNFSTRENLALPNQEEVEYNPDDGTLGFQNPTEVTAPGEGPDLTQIEVQELFVDWKSEEYKTRDYGNIQEEDKSKKMNCDEVLSYYLYSLSQKVSPDYYLILMKFIIGFRECLNKYGWEKKAENDEQLVARYQEKWQTDPPVVIPPPEDVVSKANELKQKANGLEYASINSAEHAPEICNEFVTIFMQD